MQFFHRILYDNKSLLLLSEWNVRNLVTQKSKKVRPIFESITLFICFNGTYW